MGDKDTELLTRVTANHLFLGQFEPLRATLLTLRSRNPDLARSILQTIVAHGGRFDSVLWSHSCPSPSLLTYLSTLELLQFNDPTSPIWGFDPDTLRLRAEFLLYIQILNSRVQESLKKCVDLGDGEKGVVDNDGSGDLGGIGKGIDKTDLGDLVEKDSSSSKFGSQEEELRECLRVLDRILEVGLDRLRPDLVVVDDDIETEGTSGGGLQLEEGDIMCLRQVILGNAEVFEALCGNIEKQEVKWVGDDESGLAITVTVKGKGREENGPKVLKLIQKSVQIAHLNAMKECLKASDEDGVVSHIRFLHFDYGVEETDYRFPMALLARLFNRTSCFEI